MSKQNPRDFTVQIRDPNTNQIMGTGIVVSTMDNGKIVTCAHVVENNQKVGIYFPQVLNPEDKYKEAVVCASFDDSSDDVVLLELTEPCPLTPEQQAIFSQAEGSEGNPFTAYGYKSMGSHPGGWANGEIIGAVELYGESLKLELYQLKSSGINRGMSGAGVLDNVRNMVVGIISETWIPDNTMKDLDAGWMVNIRILDLDPIKKYLADHVEEIGSVQKLRFDPHSISSPGPIEPISWNNAPKPLLEWVGRSQILADLNADWLDANKKITGLIGFGGEGKSSLARKWLENLISGDSSTGPDAIFWWGFYENKKIEEFFESLLSYLGGPNLDIHSFASPIAKAHAIIGLLKEHLKEKRCLIVLDGLEVLQYQEGDNYGLFTNDDLKTFLVLFAEQEHQSFCLITSRIALEDLLPYNNTAYTHRDVERLSQQDGKELLHRLGVKGPDEQLEEVVSEWNGHALTLSLVAAYLTERHNGDVNHIREVPAPNKNDTRYDRVNKFLRHYDEHLSQMEMAFLTIFSAFRTPVKANAIQKVFMGKFSKNAVNAPLIHLALPEIEKLIERIMGRRFIRFSSKEGSYSAHPLIVSHYRERLSTFHFSDIQSVHRDIKQYYLENVTEVPKHVSLGDVSNIIEGIYHACQAGEYNDAFKYYQMLEIPTRLAPPLGRSILMFELGAYNVYLEMARDFFADRDFSNQLLLDELWEKSTVVTDVGIALLSAGKVNQAIILHQKALDLDMQAGDMERVSASYQNIAETGMELGQLELAREQTMKAIQYARESNSLEEEWTSHAYCARACYLLGDMDSAQTYFAQAQEVHKKVEPQVKFLPDLWGGWYVSFLLKSNKFDEAFEIAQANIKYHVEDAPMLEEVSHYEWLLGSCYLALGDHEQALSHYNKSLNEAQKTSSQPAWIEALLVRGSFFARYTHDFDAAFSDLKEALGLAIQGGYKIYEVDIRIALGWARLFIGELKSAESDMAYVLRMSKEMQYHWGVVDALELQDKIAPSAH